MTENYRLIISFSYYLPPLLSFGKYLLFTSFPQFYPQFQNDFKVIIIIIIPPSFLWETHYFLLCIPDEINIKTLQLNLPTNRTVIAQHQLFLVPVSAIKPASHSQNQLVENSSELTAFCPPFYEIWR